MNITRSEISLLINEKCQNNHTFYTNTLIHPVVICNKFTKRNLFFYIYIYISKHFLPTINPVILNQMSIQSNYVIETSFLALIIVTIFIYNYAFLAPQCENYVINTYLYLAASVIILVLATQIIPQSISRSYFWTSFITSLILIIYIAIQPNNLESKTQVALNHIVWFVFIVTIGSSMQIQTSLSTQQQIIQASSYASIIFALMSLMVYIYPDYFKRAQDHMQKGLLLSLIAVIIIEVFQLWTKSATNHRFINYIVILIFSLYVSYDTSRMFDLAEQCKKLPNYPKLSTSFFLDILNLFSRSLRLFR